MKDKVIVINLFGGPGAGKSTQAADLFAELKKMGYNAELVREYAKDLNWQESFKVLSDQIYVFGKQHHRTWQLADKVSVIVTDSPLVLSLIYGKVDNPFFAPLVKWEFEQYDNINIWLKRQSKYQTEGRAQTEEQAMMVDDNIIKFMNHNQYKFDLSISVERPDAGVRILEKVKELLNGRKDREKENPGQ